MADNSDKFSKLPLLAKPSLYQIRLKLNLETCEFKGSEKIHLEITKPTSYLKLHSNALDVEKASLKLEDGTVLSDLTPEIDRKWTLLTVQLPKEIQPQKAELDFVYNGWLSMDMHGFYKSTYKDSEGNEKTLACTQFESTYARCAFPCWDEPTYKAQFDIKMEVDKGLTVLSNMNAVEEKNTETGTKQITFARTPLMSTYLVAWAVGDFEYIEAKSKVGCDVRVYCVPGKKDQGKYALEVAVKAIDFFSEWFDFKMPLPKCDIIAFPDFAMGAMENWGLITAREYAVLYDPTKSPTSHKQNLTKIVAHEVAHFWFGNLVTMKWWTDLWLKEGFASFMEYLFTDKNYPEYKICSHPIEVPIGNPNELDEIYDSITYAKSNSALRIYLKRHQYSNVDTEGLWKCLSEASGTDIGTLMSSWTQQMGFPIVTVEDSNLNGDRRELRLKQTRFLADGGQDEAKPVWQVPFGVTTAADPTHPKAKFLLAKPEDKFIVEGIKPNEWVKVNSNFTSVFRTMNSECWIVSNLPMTFIPLSNPEEEDYFVWASIDSGIANIGHLLKHLDDGDKLKQRFHRFVCKFVEPAAAKVGWEPKEGEDMHTGRLRAMLIHRLSQFQHQPTIQMALSKFNDLVEKDVEVVPDLRKVIFSTVGGTNDKKIIAALKNLMETSNYAEVEQSCIIALGQCSDTKLLAENFHYGAIEGKIRNQDLYVLFASTESASKSCCQHFAWNFYKDNFDLMLLKYGGVNNIVFLNCLKLATMGFCSSAMADEIIEFFTKNLDPHSLNTLDRPLRQVVESIKLKERLLKNNQADLDEYLQKMGF
uniref:Aminopeptidase n=1 Tax=Globodera rostochiensis TaxID=31243 RepID=A0A914HD91_GLORO